MIVFGEKGPAVALLSEKTREKCKKALYFVGGYVIIKLVCWQLF